MIRPSYHHFGKLADEDQDVLNAYEDWRMIEALFEAESAPVVDSTEFQDD